METPSSCRYGFASEHSRAKRKNDEVPWPSGCRHTSKR